MTTTMSRWAVPAVGLVLGLLIALALAGQHASPGQIALSFAIVVGYALVVGALQSRSDVASLLSGLPTDERWASINGRALSLAAQLVAVALVVAFLVVSFTGGDALPYAWVGAVFAVTYLGAIFWYRSRS